MQSKLNYLKLISILFTFVLIFGLFMSQKNQNESLKVYDKEINYRQTFEYNNKTDQNIETKYPIYTIAVKKDNEKLAAKYHVSEETYQHLHIGDYVDESFHRID